MGMYEFALPKVLNAYDIKYQRIFEYQNGYRNEIWPILTSDNQMINVTFYKREPGIIDRINHSNAVSEYLANLGMPTRRRFDNRILTLKNGNLITNISVYEYLPGKTIPWEAYTMAHIKLLGKTMSDMHANLLNMSLSDFPSVYDEYKAIIKRMRIYFSKTDVQNAINLKLNLKINLKKLDIWEKLLQKYKLIPNQQILHMDFVRGNILFDGIKISGILDFEKTSKGHVIVDISRTLAFLLVDCKYKPYKKTYKYFLYSGYHKRGISKDIGNNNDRNSFIDMFLVYDLYKFLLHNPYESLQLNEHYNRTKDILIKRGVVTY